MSITDTKIGKAYALSRGGTAQIGQISFDTAYKRPHFFPVGGGFTEYNILWTDDGGEHGYGIGGNWGAWAQGIPVPNVLDLRPYMVQAGTFSQIGGGRGDLEWGKAAYEANHSDTWDEFLDRFDQYGSWLWGNVRDGGLCFVKDGAKWCTVATYGLYKNAAGNEKIAAWQSNSDFDLTLCSSGCFATYYWVGRDSYYGSVDWITKKPASPDIQYANNQRVMYTMDIILDSQLTTNIGDTFDNSVTNYTDGSVPNCMFNLSTMTSPYNDDRPIFANNVVITEEGYSMETTGFDSESVEELGRGDGSGDNDGDGDYNNDSDAIAPVDETQFSVDAQSCGFVTVYKPDKTTLQSFAEWLYGTLPTTYSSFLEAIQKLQLNPMDGIISLNLSHFNAPIIGSEPLNFYGQMSGISAPVVTKLTHVYNCGTIHVNEYAGGWMSYNDYTKIKAYIPYCGMFSLATNEVMGADVSLRYIIDILSGACVAELQIKRNRGYVAGDPNLNAPLYRFTGNIFQQVPISAVDYSGIIQGQLGLAAGIASMATGNVLGGANGVINAAMAAPSVERVGSIGASYGYMSDQQPYIMQEYPSYNHPDAYNEYYGEPYYDFKVIGNCRGLIFVDPGTFWATDPDMADFIDMTSEEEELLKQAVAEGLYMPRTTNDFNRKNYTP